MDRKTPWLAALLGALGLAVAGLAGPACESQSPTAGATVTPPTIPLDCGDTHDGGDWPMYGGNVCNTHAGAGGPISTANASKLTVKWKYNAAGDISATPAVVAGELYVPDWGGMLSRLDAKTGAVVWSRAVSDILGVGDAGADTGASDASAGDTNDAGVTLDAGVALDAGADADGDASADASADATIAVDDASATSDAGTGDETGAVATASDAAATPARVSSGTMSRGTPVVAGSLLVFGVASFPSAILAAVNKDTGALAWQTPLDPHPAAAITASPALDNGVVYVGVTSGEEGFPALMSGYACCSFRGSVAAVDAATGKVIWQTPMIDDAVYRKPDGSLSGYSGAAVWSGTPAIDRKRKLVYVTTGNNYSAPPGAADAGLPLPEGDRLESIVALELDTGKIRWSHRVTDGDIWNFGNFDGPDYDFGDGAHLYQASVGAGVHDFVGAGQKSGVYWALDPDTGTVLWKTQVGPGGHLGGIHWGTAVDDHGIYVGVNNQSGKGYKLGGLGPQAGTKTNVGSWAALDRASGATLWQIADPAMMAPLNGTSVNGPVTVANGVLFAGSMDADGTMFAFEASTGKELWSFKSGGTVYSGPAIADGVVYWGNGYPVSRLFFGTPGHTLYAFEIAP